MDTSNTILVIDPHPARSRLLRKTLGDAYRYVVAYDLPSGMIHLDESEPDLIMVADSATGAPLESWLRQVAFSYGVPVVVIADREWSAEHVVRMLDAGAAYHLDWTDPLYLAAVVRRTLQRAGQVRKDCDHATHGQQIVGALTIDHDTHAIYVNGRMVRLTPREWQIFGRIADGNGAPVHPDEIVYRIWRERSNGSTNSHRRTLVVYIRYLRRKVGYDRITNEPHVGYRLVMEAS